MKFFYCFIIFILSGFLAFGDTGIQEEIDFLLFIPNSNSQFVNHEEAMIHLDGIANYLLDRNIAPGQVHVFGYAAAVINDIDGDQLSLERALFVINELQRRGLGAELFAQPSAFGSVDLWGSNEDEQERSPNRRARILLDGIILTPQLIPPVPAELPIPAPMTQPVTQDQDDDGGFPWILLPLLLALLAILLFFAFRSRKKEPMAAEVLPNIAAVITYTVVNLEEEIRFRAYELYLERNGLDENAYEDWCKAVIEVCARYEVKGHETYAQDMSWWACKEK